MTEIEQLRRSEQFAREHAAALEGERVALCGRLRKTAQILIECIGAQGPQNAEEAAKRLVARTRALEAELAAAARGVAIMSERECRAARERDQLVAGNLDAMRATVRAGIAVMGDQLKDKSNDDLAKLWVDATAALPVAFHCLTSETIRRLTTRPASE